MHEAGAITITVEAHNGLNWLPRQDRALLANPDPRVKPSRMQFILNEYVFDLEPIEACEAGLLALYVDPSRESVVFLPWNRDTVVVGSRSGTRFVELSARRE